MNKDDKITKKVRKAAYLFLKKQNKTYTIGDYLFKETPKLKQRLQDINQCFFNIQHLFTANNIKSDTIKLISKYYTQFYKSTMEELNNQNLTLDTYNNEKREKDPNCTYGFMLYSNQNFLEKTYIELDNYIKQMQLAIDDTILEYKTGDISSTENRFTNNYKKLSGKLINILSLNTDVYIDTFAIENFLRAYIIVKYQDKYKTNNLIELFKTNKKIESKALSRKTEDEKNGWLEPRGKTLLSYLDFDELKNLIIQNDNWILFENDFPDQDFIRIRFKELYLIRNKIAHNVNVTQQEFDMLKMYSTQIYKQLQKYDEFIKLIEV